MSQYYRRSVSSGNLPSNVPTQFTADDGTISIPDANNLNLLARDTTDNNINGVQTTADPDNGDNHYIEITNRMYGTASVTGAVTGDVITFDLGADPQVYRFQFDVAGRDTSSNDGVAYTVRGSIKTDGAAASVIDEPYIDEDEDLSLQDAGMDFIASGNNMVLQATSVAGSTINYAAYGYYVKV